MDDPFELRAFAAETLGFLRGVPDLRIFQFLQDFVESFLLDIEVKGTP
jgi:hypothetical protein